MSKDKFLIYLLSTTLIVPSLTTAPIAHAEDDQTPTHSSSSQRTQSQSNADKRVVKLLHQQMIIMTKKIKTKIMIPLKVIKKLKINLHVMILK